MTMQPPKAANNQAYGVKNEQLQAQKQIPLPQGQSPGAGASPPPAPGAGGGVQPVDLVQAAKEYDPGIVPLTAPSQRPGEPVTAGLAQGPGPGPEIFSQPTKAMEAANVLDMLAQSLGDDSLLSIAQRIRQSGGVL